MEQFGTTVNVQLLARRLGEYTVYVFKNLETGALLTVTRLPNWQDEPDVDVGTIGFLTYQFVQANKDSWRNKDSAELINYRFSANYYHSFIPSSHEIKDDTVVRRELLVG